MQKIGNVFSTPVESTLAHMTETRDSKHLNTSKLLVQASALEGKHVDDDLDHTENDEMLLPFDVAGTKPIDIEMHDAESHEDLCFKTIEEGATMCFGRNCKTKHRGLKIDPRECGIHMMKTTNIAFCEPVGDCSSLDAGVTKECSKVFMGVLDKGRQKHFR